MSDQCSLVAVMFPMKIMRQISEISYVGGFKLIRMASTQDREAQVAIPLRYNEAYWKNMFDKYDRDGNGRISLSELKRMVKSSEYSTDFSATTVSYIMKQADLDGSGSLNYPEFIAMIHRRDMQGIFGQYINRYIRKVVPQRLTAPAQKTRSGRSQDSTDGQYEEQYTCMPPPIAMIIISIIEIILFIYDLVVAPNKESLIGGPSASLFIYNPYKRYEAWRYLTYMFVHVGPFHLIINLLVQIMLGIPLEMVHKWWRVVIIYFAGVIAGSLGTSVSDPGVYLAGASGGVYALITAHVATIIMNWKEMEYALIQLITFIVITGVDVGQAIYNRYIVGSVDQIGYVAHFAGAVAGLLVGINILRNLEVETWEKAVWWASIITFTLLMTAAVLWNALYPSYFPKSI